MMGRLKAFTSENTPDSAPVQHIIGSGNLYEKTLSAATEFDVDLIIITAGRSDLKEFPPGSNAARVVRYGDVSVLIMR